MIVFSLGILPFTKNIQTKIRPYFIDPVQNKKQSINGEYTIVHDRKNSIDGNDTIVFQASVITLFRSYYSY